MPIAEKFEAWMEKEAAYSLLRFKPADQYRFWESGLGYGAQSFTGHSLGYMHTAVVYAREHRLPHDAMSLQITQSLGKAAYNLVALCATARSYHAGGQSFVRNVVTSLSELADHVEPVADIDADAIEWTERQRKLTMLNLQLLQDAGHLDQLTEVLGSEMRLAANQFATAGEVFGWPTPGLPSGPVPEWQ